MWYQFTPSEDIRINANTFGSDYDTGIAVFTGTRGALSLVLCNDDAMTGEFVQSNLNFDAVAGTTYYFMVGSCCGSDGGNLVFNVDVGRREATGLNTPMCLKMKVRSHSSMTVWAKRWYSRSTIGTCSLPEEMPRETFTSGLRSWT